MVDVKEANQKFKNDDVCMMHRHLSTQHHNNQNRTQTIT